MTRINVVTPQSLTDQHLMAEYRELTMVHASLRRSLKTKTVREVLSKIPKAYTLNTGHVTFFYDKLVFLRRRYEALIDELKTRGYDLDPNRVIQDEDLPKEFFNDWVPDANALAVMKPRLQERLKQKVAFYKFYGDPVWEGFYDNVEVWTE